MLKASSILLSDGLFVFITTKAGFLSGTRLSSGTVDFAILYSTVIGDNSQDFSWLNRTFVHLVNVDDLADGGWSFRLLERSYFDHFIPARSLVFSVPGEGFYLITGEREGRIGSLVEPGHLPGFWVNSSGRFVPEVSVLWMQSHTPPTTRPATLTPLATATESIAFIQSAKLSQSGVGEASLCFDDSYVLETPMMMPSSSRRPSRLLLPESFTVTDSNVFPHSSLPRSAGFVQSRMMYSANFLLSQLRYSEGFPPSRLRYSGGFLQSGLQYSESFVQSNVRHSAHFMQSGMPHSAFFVQSRVRHSVGFLQSQLRYSDGFLQSGLPHSASLLSFALDISALCPPSIFFRSDGYEDSILSLCLPSALPHSARFAGSEARATIVFVPSSFGSSVSFVPSSLGFSGVFWTAIFFSAGGVSESFGLSTLRCSGRFVLTLVFSPSWTFTPLATATRSPVASPTRSKVPPEAIVSLSISEFVTVVKSLSVTQSQYESLSLTVSFAAIVVGKETVAPSWTFVGGESTLVGVLTIVDVESYTAVESVLRSIAFTWLELPVYVTTVSLVPFAVAAQTVTVPEGFGIAAMTGAVCGSAIVISLSAALFLYLRRISKVSEVQLGGPSAIAPGSKALPPKEIVRKLPSVATSQDGQRLEQGDFQSPFSKCPPHNFTDCHLFDLTMESEDRVEESLPISFTRRFIPTNVQDPLPKVMMP
jgi:hypothetical protein